MCGVRVRFIRPCFVRPLKALGLFAAVAGGAFATVWLLAVGPDRPESASAPSASGLTVIRAGAPAQGPRAATRSTAPALVSLPAAAAPVFRRHAPPAAGGASHHAARPAHAPRAAAPRPAPKPARAPAPSPPPPPAPAPTPPTPPSAPPAPPSPSVGGSQIASLVPAPTPVPPRATSTPVTHELSGNDPAAYWTPERMRDVQPAPMGIPGGHGTMTTDLAQPPAGGQDEVTNRPSASDPAAYWTPERMRDAQPASMGIPGGHSTRITNLAPQPPLGGQDEGKHGTPLGQSNESEPGKLPTSTQNTDAKGAGKANSPPVPVTASTSAASPGSSAKDQGSETGAKASNGSAGGKGAKQP